MDYLQNGVEVRCFEKGEERSAIAYLVDYKNPDNNGKLFKDNEVSFVYVYNKPVDADRLSVQKEELSGVEWFDLKYVYSEKLKHNRTFCVPVDGLKTLMKYLRLSLT